MRDALSATKTFKARLRMQIIGKSKKEKDNHKYIIYILQTHDVKFVVTTSYLGEFMEFASSFKQNSKETTKNSIKRKE
jgi:hypothetical protein